MPGNPPVLTLTAAPCPQGAILPLAPTPLRGMIAHAVSGPLPEALRVGSVLRDGAGEALFKVAGRALLPSANPHAVFCPLLVALAPCSGGDLELSVRREGWALAWITLSDKGAAGLRRDESGPCLAHLARRGLFLGHEQGFLLPDEPRELSALVMELAGQGYDLILSTGGTGLSPRDTTPETLLPLLERRLPGFEQAVLAAGLAETPHAALSRPVAGTLGRTLILALPGSRKAVAEGLAAVLPALPHALEKLHGDTRDCGPRADSGTLCSRVPSCPVTL